jgi:hypothetical protein
LVRGWARVKVDIDYFVRQLLAIRRIGSTWFLAMIQTYIFLRDQHAVIFATGDGVNSQLNASYAAMEASDSTQTAAEGISVSKCKKIQADESLQGWAQVRPLPGLA